MLDSIIEALHTGLSNRYPSKESRRRQDLENSDLPETVTALLIADVDREASRELANIAPSHFKWIDGTSPDVARRIADLKETCLSEARIPADEWQQCLRRVSALVVGAFTSPEVALRDFVFGESNELPADAVQSRIASFAIRPDLCEAVLESLHRRNLDTVASERFVSIVEKVDDLRTDGFTAEMWLRELAPLCALLGALGLDESLPTTDVVAYLSSRGHQASADQLSSNGSSRLTLSEAIEAVVGIPAVESAESDRADWTLFASAPPATTPAKKAEVDGAVPLWKRFQKNLNAPIGQPGATSSSQGPAPQMKDIGVPKNRSAATASLPFPSVKAIPSKSTSPPATDSPRPTESASERSQRPLWQQYRSGGSSSAKTEDRPDMNELEMSILGKDAAHDREAFIGQLFGGEEEAYLNILLEISRTKSWSEASRVIADRVFKRYQVNIYSEPAVAFTNAVEARYRSKSVGA